MTFKLRNIAAATSAALMMAFGANAMADSTTDIVNALVSKGVLTEEEGALLTRGRTDEAAGQAKALKKASKLSISDAIDKATVYGDIRVRYEDRHGKGVAGTAVGVDTTTERRERARYKLTFGVKTESGDWYSDLAFAMGANGRSDNATFGNNGNDGNMNKKETLFVKRAMVGFKATDWLNIDAGRMENPLYTTPMVWDADLTVEGLAQKAKFKMGNADIFLTALQGAYQGDKKNFSAVTPDSITTELFAFQAGVKYAFTDNTSAKAALTYTDISHNTNNTKFSPGTRLGGSVGATTSYSAAAYGVNNLNLIEIPAEVNYMFASNVGVRLFGDYAYNMDADARARRSGLGLSGARGSDDSAWMLGVAVGSAKDLKTFESNKMAKGDWSARLWYQDVGVWSVDANAVDSDFMDSRVNMKGTVAKAAYNIADNVIANFAYGHATRKNNAFGSAGSAGDLGLNLKSFDLVQFDLTYKF